MARRALKGKAQTVHGLVRPAELGITPIHFGHEGSYDLLSSLDTPNDALRLRIPTERIGHAHLVQFLVSQDICTKHRLTRYGGHGYDHLAPTVVPRMRRRRSSDEQASALLERNPQGALTLT